MSLICNGNNIDVVPKRLIVITSSATQLRSRSVQRALDSSSDGSGLEFGACEKKFSLW